MKKQKILSIQQGIIQPENYIYFLLVSCTNDLQREIDRIEYFSHRLCSILSKTVFLRFKKEELKIEAWESLQKAKIESEMKRIEVHPCFVFSSFVYLNYSHQHNTFLKCSIILHGFFTLTMLVVLLKPKSLWQEHAEKLRSEAMAKMAEKLEMTRRLAEEKRASANARMNQQAAKAVHKAELIRQTGRVPGSCILCCSGCFCQH